MSSATSIAAAAPLPPDDEGEAKSRPAAAAAAPPPLPALVATVIAGIQQEIVAGDMPAEGTIATVVAVIRGVIDVTRYRRDALSPAALERLMTRAVARLIPDAAHPVRKHLPAILWALRFAAATDKAAFGGAAVQWATTAPVDAVLAAMQRVQALANSSTAGKMSAAVLQGLFAQEMGKLSLSQEVVLETQALVGAGLVTEVLSMLKDDGELSIEMRQKLKATGLRVAVAVAHRARAWCCK